MDDASYKLARERHALWVLFDQANAAFFAAVFDSDEPVPPEVKAEEEKRRSALHQFDTTYPGCDLKSADLFDEMDRLRALLSRRGIDPSTGADVSPRRRERFDRARHYLDMVIAEGSSPEGEVVWMAAFLDSLESSRPEGLAVYPGPLVSTSMDHHVTLEWRHGKHHFLVMPLADEERRGVWHSEGGRMVRVLSVAAEEGESLYAILRERTGDPVFGPLG